MKPHVRLVEAFEVRGVHVRTDNSAEINSSTAKIPNLWERFKREILSFHLIESEDSHPESYGIYFNYESDSAGAYDVLVGLGNEYHRSHEHSSVLVEGGSYLVFASRGQMDEALIECWGNAWHFFSSPNCVVRRSYATDFEQHIPPDNYLLHIGVNGGY